MSVCLSESRPGEDAVSAEESHSVKLQQVRDPSLMTPHLGSCLARGNTDWSWTLTVVSHPSPGDPGNTTRER